MRTLHSQLAVKAHCGGGTRILVPFMSIRKLSMPNAEMSRKYSRNAHAYADPNGSVEDDDIEAGGMEPAILCRPSAIFF